MHVRAYEAFLHICLTDGALRQWYVCGDQRGLYRVGSFLLSLYMGSRDQIPITCPESSTFT